MQRTVSAAALLLGLAVPPLHAQNVEAATSDGLTISGFVSATLYVENQVFGRFTQGQAANTAPLETVEDDAWFHGGDVRNSRISFGFAREQEGGWRTGARLELDLFGGFFGNEPFGDEMPIPRLRLAYVDLTNGTTTIRFGQAWAPILGNVPASLSHIAFPLGYGSGGVIGWRFPGVFLYHDLAAGEELAVQLQLAAMAGSWSHVGPGRAPDYPSAGEASLIPQLEARLNLSGGTELPWSAYVVGHVDRKDRNGLGFEAGVDPTTGNDDAAFDPLTGTAFQVGGSVRPGPVTLQGNAYYGSAVGQLLGAITQIGDFVGIGGWAQVGYQIDPRLSVWAFAGQDDARDGGAPLPELALDSNRLLAGMVRYDLEGYSVGLEVLNARTEYTGETATVSHATQFALSVLYAF